MNKKRVRFAVVGCGHVGKRHAHLIQRNEESEVVALCDIRPADEVGANEFDVPYFNSLEEMLKKVPEIDVVNVCTPNGLHFSQSITALENDKHVVCEKPMALSKADCEEIIYKSLKVSRHVFCVMQNRYSPPSVWIKDVIEKKLMGDIYMVQVNCYWNRDERYYKTNPSTISEEDRKVNWKGTSNLDGGTLFTQFSHFLDIMYWLFGDITDIEAKFADFSHHNSTEFEDSGLIHFSFVNGGIGCINYSTAVWDSNLESSLTIIGKKGSIKIGGQYMNEVEYCNIENYSMPDLPEGNPANDYGGYKGSAANHHFVIDNVVNTLKGGTSATTNALEGLKVVEIIERIYSFKKEKNDSRN